MNVTPRADGRFDVRIRAIINVMTTGEALALAAEIYRVVVPGAPMAYGIGRVSRTVAGAVVGSAGV